MDVVKERVSILLQRHMDATGKKQHQIADDLGIHQTMVSSYVRKAKCPSIDKLIAIAKLTNADIRDLLSDN